MDYNFINILAYIGNVITPTDELIFFRGVGIPPTSLCTPVIIDTLLGSDVILWALFIWKKNAREEETHTDALNCGFRLSKAFGAGNVFFFPAWSWLLVFAVKMHVADVLAQRSQLHSTLCSLLSPCQSDRDCRSLFCRALLAFSWWLW